MSSKGLACALREAARKLHVTEEGFQLQWAGGLLLQKLRAIIEYLVKIHFL